jgi:hypothetical protein
MPGILFTSGVPSTVHVGQPPSAVQSGLWRYPAPGFK